MFSFLLYSLLENLKTKNLKGGKNMYKDMCKNFDTDYVFHSSSSSFLPGPILFIFSPIISLINFNFYILFNKFNLNILSGSND